MFDGHSIDNTDALWSEEVERDLQEQGYPVRGQHVGATARRTQLSGDGMPAAGADDSQRDVAKISPSPARNLDGTTGGLVEAEGKRGYRITPRRWWAAAIQASRPPRCRRSQRPGSRPAPACRRVAARAINTASTATNIASRYPADQRQFLASREMDDLPTPD